MEIRECSWSWRTPLVRRSETTRIILHHAAAASCTAEDVHRWHLAHGWSGIGYHYFVSKDGEITRGRPLWAVGAHAEGSNRVSVGICFEGNFQLEEEMPAAQRQAGRALVAALRERYPAARVLGHRDVATGGTTCPGKYFPFEEIAGGQAESREGDEIMVTTQMIGSGDRGNAVKSMQGALVAQGYPCGSYGADGICGAATVSAIRAFQTANGLTADGICGQDTWGALLRK